MYVMGPFAFLLVISHWGLIVYVLVCKKRNVRMCKLGTEVHFSSLPPRLSAELSLLSAELSHYTGLYN